MNTKNFFLKTVFFTLLGISFTGQKLFSMPEFEGEENLEQNSNHQCSFYPASFISYCGIGNKNCPKKESQIVARCNMCSSQFCSDCTNKYSLHNMPCKICENRHIIFVNPKTSETTANHFRNKFNKLYEELLETDQIYLNNVNKNQKWRELCKDYYSLLNNFILNNEYFYNDIEIGNLCDKFQFYIDPKSSTYTLALNDMEKNLENIFTHIYPV